MTGPSSPPSPIHPVSVAETSPEAGRLLAVLAEGEMGEALRMLPNKRIALDRAALDGVLEDLFRQRKRAGDAGDHVSARRLGHWIRSLTCFRDHGADPAWLLPPVALPEGCRGKILLVRVTGLVGEARTLLRSGDAWHREILRNLALELADLGLGAARADPLGGAWIRCDPDGALVLWGTSEAFGRCDRDLAADLLRRAFPERTVRSEW